MLLLSLLLSLLLLLLLSPLLPLLLLLLMLLVLTRLSSPAGTAHARGVGETLDFSATGGEPPLTQPGLAKPLHVSRAVADVSVMVEFYTTVFGVSPTSQSAIPGGGKLLTYVLPSSKVAIRYVERPEAKLGTSGSLPAAKLWIPKATPCCSSLSKSPQVPTPPPGGRATSTR